MAKKSWIQTLQGRQLEPLALTKEMVGSIEEIAHSLAHEYRFTRQTDLPYSVAEHCVRGSRLLPAAFAGAFLLHELSEVYLPDIAGPLKPSVLVRLPDDPVPFPWEHLERQHTRVILESLGLSSIEPLLYSAEVKHMDLAMLAAEKRDLCGTEPAPWGLTVDPAPTGLITPMKPHYARDQFLERFRELFTVPK